MRPQQPAKTSAEQKTKDAIKKLKGMQSKAEAELLALQQKIQQQQAAGTPVSAADQKKEQHLTSNIKNLKELLENHEEHLKTFAHKEPDFFGGITGTLVKSMGNNLGNFLLALVVLIVQAIKKGIYKATQKSVRSAAHDLLADSVHDPKTGTNSEGEAKYLLREAEGTLDDQHDTLQQAANDQQTGRTDDAISKLEQAVKEGKTAQQEIHDASTAIDQGEANLLASGKPGTNAKQSALHAAAQSGLRSRRTELKKAQTGYDTNHKAVIQQAKTLLSANQQAITDLEAAQSATATVGLAISAGLEITAQQKAQKGAGLSRAQKLRLGTVSDAIAQGIQSNTPAAAQHQLLSAIERNHPIRSTQTSRLKTLDANTSRTADENRELSLLKQLRDRTPLNNNQKTDLEHHRHRALTTDGMSPADADQAIRDFNHLHKLETLLRQQDRLLTIHDAANVALGQANAATPLQQQQSQHDTDLNQADIHLRNAEQLISKINPAPTAAELLQAQTELQAAAQLHHKLQTSTTPLSANQQTKLTAQIARHTNINQQHQDQTHLCTAKEKLDAATATLASHATTPLTLAQVQQAKQDLNNAGAELAAVTTNATGQHGTPIQNTQHQQLSTQLTRVTAQLNPHLLQQADAILNAANVRTDQNSTPAAIQTATDQLNIAGSLIATVPASNPHKQQCVDQIGVLHNLNRAALQIQTASQALSSGATPAQKVQAIQAAHATLAPTYPPGVAAIPAAPATGNDPWATIRAHRDTLKTQQQGLVTQHLNQALSAMNYTGGRPTSTPLTLPPAASIQQAQAIASAYPRTTSSAHPLLDSHALSRMHNQITQLVSIRNLLTTANDQQNQLDQTISQVTASQNPATPAGFQQAKTHLETAKAQLVALNNTILLANGRMTGAKREDQDFLDILTHRRDALKGQLSAAETTQKTQIDQLITQANGLHTTAQTSLTNNGLTNPRQVVNDIEALHDQIAQIDAILPAAPAAATPATPDPFQAQRQQRGRLVQQKNQLIQIHLQQADSAADAGLVAMNPPSPNRATARQEHRKAKSIVDAYIFMAPGKATPAWHKVIANNATLQRLRNDIITNKIDPLNRIIQSSTATASSTAGNNPVTPAPPRQPAPPHQRQQQQRRPGHKTANNTATGNPAAPPQHPPAPAHQRQQQQRPPAPPRQTGQNVANNNTATGKQTRPQNFHATRTGTRTGTTVTGPLNTAAARQRTQQQQTNTTSGHTGSVTVSRNDKHRPK